IGRLNRDHLRRLPWGPNRRLRLVRTVDPVTSPLQNEGDQDGNGSFEISFGHKLLSREECIQPQIRLPESSFGSLFKMHHPGFGWVLSLTEILSQLGLIYRALRN